MMLVRSSWWTRTDRRTVTFDPAQDVVAFDDSGQLGVAVGHKYPVTQGGFALVTTDGGATWSALDADVPLLESAAVSGGRFYIAGDAYLASGAME
jgi:hypothetical protein